MSVLLFKLPDIEILPHGYAYAVRNEYVDPWRNRKVAGTLFDLESGEVQPGRIAWGSEAEMCTRCEILHHCACQVAGCATPGRCA